MKTDRLLEYQILKLWSDIKKERKNVGFSSTKLNLAVKIKQSFKDNVLLHVKRDDN
jgi:hypothetical protein